MKTSIKKIVFNVGGKTLELSKEEAKELKEILSDLFGENKVIHEWNTWPYRYWGSSPYVTYTANGLSNNYSGALTTGTAKTTDTVYLTASSTV